MIGGFIKIMSAENFGQSLAEIFFLMRTANYSNQKVSVDGDFSAHFYLICAEFFLILS